MKRTKQTWQKPCKVILKFYKPFCLQRTKILSSFLSDERTMTSGGSRIFPRGGVNPPGGAWTRQIFPKTAWNRKNLDARGGRASLTPPPRSANDDTNKHVRKVQNEPRKMRYHQICVLLVGVFLRKMQTVALWNIAKLGILLPKRHVFDPINWKP